MWTYKILDHLPHPPKKFLDIADEYLKNNDWGHDPLNLAEKYKDRVLLRNGESVGFTFHHYHELDEEFVEWAHKEIHPDAFDCGIRFLDGKPGPFLGPHTDIRRDISIMYVLDHGGADVETVWYQEEGHDVVRGRSVHANDYSKLDVVDRVRFPERTWVILNTLILHGVENVTGVRTAFQLSANEDIWSK